MKKIDLIVKIISWLTVLLLLALAMPGKNIVPPEWAAKWLLPILTGAAVGYLTNWIAIWLLFKPYEKHWGFLQGVIPRNKAKMGVALGAMIPQYLLKPDELADQLGTLVRDYLQNPELLCDVRAKTNIFLRKYSDDIANFLLPYIEGALRDGVRSNLTPENLQLLYDSVVIKFLSDPANRQLLAAGIAAELQHRAPELTALLKSNMRAEAANYVRESNPLLNRVLSLDELTGKLIDHLNWERIGKRIEERLNDPDTRQAISSELVTVTGKIRECLAAPDYADTLQRFLDSRRDCAEEFIRSYLAREIPGMVDRWLQKDELWDAVEKQLLPLVQSFILHRLKREKTTIISRFDFSGKIEHSVAAMDVAELHAMINHISGEHLTAIQVLGYLLGGLAGLLLIFAS